MTLEITSPGGAVLSRDTASTLRVAVCVSGRTVTLVFVVRDHVVEVWVMGSMTATVARPDLVAFFAGPQDELRTPVLTFTSLTNQSTSITLPGLECILSPESWAQLRDLVCRELVPS